MSSSATHQRLEEDALELAQIILDNFIEQQNDGTIKDGQNNANQTKDN